MKTSRLKGMVLGKIVIGFLVVISVLSLPILISSIIHMNIAMGLQNGVQFDSWDMQALDVSRRFIGTSYTVLYIPFFILFLLWFRKVYLNLELFGRDTNYHSGWAIGGFFVPLLNLVRPYQIGSEIIDKSRSGTIYQLNALPVKVWWFSQLLSGFLGNVLVHVFPDTSNSIEKYVLRTQLTVGSDAVDVVYNISFLYLVITIMRMQNEKMQEVHASRILPN